MSVLPPRRPLVEIPDCAWSRPIGLGWQQPYRVRYTSNLDDGPWHGMPLGGFGAGCVGRSPRGEFNLWHIDGGEHVFQTIPACQFSVFEQGGDRRHAYALCTEAPSDGSLSTWQWYPPSHDSDHGLDSSPQPTTGTYHALYPRSWFAYEQVFQAQLTCEQFSPIIAHNYQETSYPVAVFQWTAHNPTSEPITLSIMLTWQNIVGWFTNALKSPDVRLRDDGSPVYEYQPKWGESQGNFNTLTGDEQRLGIVMGRGQSCDSEADSSMAASTASSMGSVAEGDGQWAIATFLNPLQEVFYHTRWNPTGDGSELWQTFSRDGSLSDVDDSAAAAAAEQIGGAIAVRFTLRPGQTRQIPFILAWDFPVTEFAQGVEYFRRYTDFFGRNGRNAWSMVRTGLKLHQTWREQIQAWQAPILDRQDLPNWFKMALCNELYDLTDGGALWSAADERDPVGQYAVLECLDYRWYESLDVRLYGSFALLRLFPELEKAVIRAFARAIPAQDDRTRVIGYYHTIGAASPLAVRKAPGATPHDLGAPNEHVWEKTNYTSYQDCNLWKDLPSDFVLQVYRDYWLTGATDVAFLAECWDAVVQTLHYLKTFDQDGDGIPENSGAPDQTFDDWKLQGISAYCGGLWLAALEAAIAIGNRLAAAVPVGPLSAGAQTDKSVSSTPLDNVAITASVTLFQHWLEQSRPIYQAKLWNGQYYRLDSDSGSDVVMADQLCGQFYARLLDLPDIVPADCAQLAIQSVYEACFIRFNQYLEQGGISGSDGRIQEAVDQPIGRSPLPIGAANGVKPNGEPENPNATHPLEVWTGINFGLAAFLLQMGLKTEAFDLTEAVVRQIYTSGLQFRTPEAITANATFRACHYLRPMAIWAIYHVLETATPQVSELSLP
jgi:non-lysosomal glucosylceramidase